MMRLLHLAALLLPSLSLLAQEKPKNEKKKLNTVDHAGILQELGAKDLARGKEIYATLCTNCHGDDGKIAPLPIARAFGKDELKFGADPYSMFQVLTEGRGTMGPQTWMTPRERYAVIHYIRQTFMKPMREDFVAINDGYLEGLPTVEAAPEDEKIGERNFGPALASQLGRDISSVLSIDLGDKTTISYNLHSLDQAGLWEEGFVDLKATQHFRERGGGVAQAGGPPIKGLQGWKWAHEGLLDYPTENLLPRGPLPSKWLEYKGHYVHEDRVVLSYSINGRTILEAPSKVPGYRAIAHRFRIEPGETLQLSIAQADPDPSTRYGFLPAKAKTFKIEENGPLAVIANIPKAGLQNFTAAAVIGLDEQLVHAPKNRLVLEIPDSKEPLEFEIIRSSGNGEGALLAFSTFVENHTLSPSPSTLIKGGPENWPEELTTKGKLGDSSKAYALDTLTLPPGNEGNPYNVWFRTSALDFFPDGRMAVCTHGGDVWVVSDIDKELGAMKWKRFAAGMYEPFGLQIVDDTIYVTCKDRLTRLHDLNQDGEADFYESFSADDDVSTFFHAFNFDLQRDAEGNFYYAKSGQYTSYKEAGAIIKVSPDGKKREIYCRGLRTPNGMGMMPNGHPTVSDNQGTWMPASKISLTRPGGFYGYVQTAAKGTDWAPDGGRIDHTKVVPPSTFDQPLIWMPQDYDNSSGGQLWVDDKRWGPLAGRLLHTSFGKGWLYYLSVQENDDSAQASIVKMELDGVTGIHRARVNPADGQVYATGLNGWNGHGRKGLAQGGIHRFRYTGKPVRILEKSEVVKEGIRLHFNFDLDPETADDPAHYELEQWNYLWRSAYGSKQYQPGDDWKEGRSPVKIAGVELDEDGRSLLLRIPDLRPVNQLRMELKVPDKAGGAFEQEVYATINFIPGKDIPTMKEMTKAHAKEAERLAKEQKKKK